MLYRSIKQCYKQEIIVATTHNGYVNVSVIMQELLAAGLVNKASESGAEGHGFES